MKEESPTNLNNINNNLNKIIPDLKEFPTTNQSKEIQNSSVNKKNNISNLSNNLTFKITEKECSYINSIVRSSVEKINDLLNSKEFSNSNFSKTFKRSSKNCIAEILEREKDKEKEKISKAKTLKESGMKTNFTFNINNFINVPNEHNKNGSLNINKKTERDEEDEIGIINEHNFSDKNSNILKAKSNQKGCNLNNRTKNNNYLNYGSNRHNNGKLFRNCVRKKKLFDDVNNNYNNNINIVNYTNGQKNKKSQHLDTKEDKDKSITVNTKHKKNNLNENSNFVNDNNKDKNNILVHNTLNSSLKPKKKESNNNMIKYSISEDINNSKMQSIKKSNIINLNNFSPNIISINSLSDHRNIKNSIFNNKDLESNFSKNRKQNNNCSVSKYNKNDRKNKSKEKDINKKVFSPPFINRYKPYIEEKNKEKEIYYNNFNLIDNNPNEEKNELIKYKTPSLPVNNPINNNQIINNNKVSFSKTFTTNSKLISFNNINIKSNDSFCNIVDFEKRNSTNNKFNLKKEKSSVIKKCGYSCDHFNRNNKSNNTQNAHQILNKIYSKEFPTKIRTNNMMKLMLFLNEYIINNNLLDDYYDINNRKKLDIYSKFLCDQINIDFPQEDDVNIDKMVNSAKKIQRMWRKKKIAKFIGNNSEENELKKMVINKYIKNSGFKIKKIIGLFNSLVEDFNNIGNQKEMEEMFYNIQQIIKRKLTSYEKNNLYKEYINTIFIQNN